MNYRGFVTGKSEYGLTVELTMPEELRGIFFARLYARGPLNDGAEGEPELVWKRLSREYGNRGLVAPRQIHGTTIIDADNTQILPKRAEADGVFIESGREALASLRFADCAPVVIAAMCEKPWMAILHSGFKGTLLNITAAAVNGIFKRFPERRGAKLWGWIAPAVGGECYSREKSDPASIEAMKKFSAVNRCERGGLCYFDIRGEIRRQLLECGLSEENIFVYEGCNCCHREFFYSYRGGDSCKRNFLLAGASINREKV
ncbi:MAG: laccase domain-containing protein [Synergistaceae bacterium]|nr:laccase domain-containing protein [Synergistaceae bacterium]